MGVPWCFWVGCHVGCLAFVDVVDSVVVGPYISCFSWIIDSMLRNPVSSCMISLGVDVGVFRILFMILSNIVCMCFISFLVIVQVSVAYSSVGIRHVSMSFHIVFISILLKLLIPAILNIVWIVASALPFNLLM